MAEAFDVRIVSGARRHGISRQRIGQALLSQAEAEAWSTSYAASPSRRALDRDGLESGSEASLSRRKAQTGMSQEEAASTSVRILTISGSTSSAR